MSFSESSQALIIPGKSRFIILFVCKVHNLRNNSMTLFVTNEAIGFSFFKASRAIQK